MVIILGHKIGMWNHMEPCIGSSIKTVHVRLNPQGAGGLLFKLFLGKRQMTNFDLKLFDSRTS